MSLEFLAFLQSAGIVVYCGLIGLVLWQGNTLFGVVPNFWGPLLFLVLFSTSALICALLAFGNAFQFLYVKKEPQKAIKLVALTTIWLMLFVVLVLILLAL